MKKLIQLVLLLTCSLPAWGSTWYIRTDGGTNTRCTGLVNAPDPGSGSAQPCAYNHPFQMLNSSGAWTALTAGDTIQFEDQGPYYIGQKISGSVGTDWSTQISGVCAGSNPVAACTFPLFPNNITIRGANTGSCHNANGLVNPTVLSGINGVFAALNFQGSNHMTISCIEVTQPDTCTDSGASPYIGQCTPGTSNYISYGGIVFEYLVNQGPSNLTMSDVAVIGLAHDGILGSKINSSGGDVTNIDHLYIIGNGDSGYNGDGGGCNTSCESVGTINHSYMEVDWNGCVAVKPYVWASGISGNAYTYCYDDINGGYGDGFVQIAAGNMTETITHSHFGWNTQDGLDALHLSDDNTTSPTVTVTDSWSEGNMGATFKIGAGLGATAINNVSNGNCRVMATASNFALNPTGWNAGLGDFCRAAGDEWSMQLGNSTTVTLENNTSVGYGNTMYNFVCSFYDTTCVASGARVIFRNNISKGYPDPNGTGGYPGGFSWGTDEDPLPLSGSNASYNLWNTMNSSACPGDAAETNYVCADPLLVAESNVNAINPNLTSGSPARGAGITISGITTDYNGVTRPNPPSIGAFEFVTVAPPTGLFISAGTSISPGVSIQ